MGEYIPYDRKRLEQIAKSEKKAGNIIVLTGGSFDIFWPHLVQVLFLRQCKDCGYKYRDNLLKKLPKTNIEENEPLVRLFVNVVNDNRVRLYRKEGPVPRPLFTAENRAINVSSIDAVDYTTIHPYVGNPNDGGDIGPTERLAGIIKSDIIIKGKGWKRGEKKKIREFLRYNVILDEILIDEEGLNSTGILEYFGRLKMNEILH